MKYASSIVRGGELVDASECDYGSYKKLGLLCPECKDPVFLKSEGMRFLGEKEVKIGAHFSHFANKNPEQAKVCEKRVSGYTQSDIDRAISKGRGQRLKLLQRWFWDMFIHSLFKEFKEEKNIFLEELNDELLPIFDRPFFSSLVPDDVDCSSIPISSYSEPSDFPSVYIKDGSKYFCFGCISLNDIAKAMQEEKWLEEHLYQCYNAKKEVQSPVERSFHLRVCLEISNFLNSKKNFHLIQAVTGSGIIAITCEWQWFITRILDGYSLANVIGARIARLIWDVNWVEEFARLSAEPKAIAS